MELAIPTQRASLSECKLEVPRLSSDAKLHGGIDTEGLYDAMLHGGIDTEGLDDAMVDTEWLDDDPLLSLARQGVESGRGPDECCRLGSLTRQGAESGRGPDECCRLGSLTHQGAESGHEPDRGCRPGLNKELELNVEPELKGLGEDPGGARPGGARPTVFVEKHNSSTTSTSSSPSRPIAACGQHLERSKGDDLELPKGDDLELSKDGGLKLTRPGVDPNCGRC